MPVVAPPADRVFEVPFPVPLAPPKLLVPNEFEPRLARARSGCDRPARRLAGLRSEDTIEDCNSLDGVIILQTVSAQGRAIAVRAIETLDPARGLLQYLRALGDRHHGIHSGDWLDLDDTGSPAAIDVLENRLQLVDHLVRRGSFEGVNSDGLVAQPLDVERLDHVECRLALDGGTLNHNDIARGVGP